MSDGEPSNGNRNRGSRFSIATWVVLYGLWIILSGKFAAFHLTVGILSVAFFAWMQLGLHPMRSKEDPRFNTLSVILYVPWLVWQMFVSALHVAVCILRDPKNVDPCLVEFRSQQPSIAHRVVLANSITLTPGTLTVDLQGDRFVMHALTRVTADEVIEGKLARRVSNLSPKSPVADPIIDQVKTIDSP